MPAKMTFCRRFVFAFALLLPLGLRAATPVPYDIVYIRQPRFGDNTNTTWPEVFHPASIDPGADLMLLHPNGTEEVLVAGGNGAVTDPGTAMFATKFTATGRNALLANAVVEVLTANCSLCP